jgi:hypothetical protein
MNGTTPQTLRITLADGTARTFTVASLPKHWKSWLMAQMPYGTDFVDATFNRTH